ncbi:hypothetical protein ABEV00_23480 [Paenibacillus thiaminolyticus]|uniref:CysS/YqeB C-terminal domain-containing protein n=1 Tax=Paenibacillus TaxID=44249 RepID=UPI001059300F|nr:hypothetical protein [Paenibacillus dendritiformis]TDL49700.1 hypothetical protein E2R60_23515 [Paenibacillus dendritiformis]
MSGNHTLLNFSKTDKVILWLGFPFTGLVFGWFLPSIAKWGTCLPWVPFEGPLKLIASYKRKISHLYLWIKSNWCYSPDLSPAANALLKARKIAIDNGDDEEAFQLAKELWKLRVSVKENDKRQYYR